MDTVFSLTVLFQNRVKKDRVKKELGVYIFYGKNKRKIRVVKVTPKCVKVTRKVKVSPVYGTLSVLD